MLKFLVICLSHGTIVISNATLETGRKMLLETWRMLEFIKWLAHWSGMLPITKDRCHINMVEDSTWLLPCISISYQGYFLSVSCNDWFPVTDIIFASLASEGKEKLSVKVYLYNSHSGRLLMILRECIPKKWYYEVIIICTACVWPRWHLANMQVHI